MIKGLYLRGNNMVMIDPERIQRLVERVNSTSNAEFVKRLLDERRRTLRNTDGTVSTHELAYVTDDNGNAVVYPEVQSSMYGLMRYPSVNAYERAVERGDTLQMSAPDAELFTRNYKDYYPGFDLYACGGKKYGSGGDKGKRQRMLDEVASDILAQSRYNGRASGVNNIDYPLVDLHPELDLSLMLAQPGSAFTKLMAPTAYRGMANGFANGEGAQALIYGLSPETGEWSEISKRAEDIPDSTVYTNAAFEKAAADRGFADGGSIHIDPSKRGTFTAAAKKHGKSVQAFATQVLAHKENYSPAMIKKANFARNSRKWKHGDGGPLDNYFYDGGPYGIIPFGGDYLTYLQTIPEVSGGVIDPAVVTAALPAKFNGSQAAAARYAEGYLKGAKPVSEAMSRAGQDIFNTVDTVVGLTPTPAGALTWLGHMGKDAVEGEWGKVGRDALIATALGAGARGIGWLKNYVDDATNFGEDIFRAFTDRVPGRVSTNFTYAVPVTRATMETVPTVEKAVSAPYEIADLGGGYMLKSLMRGNPLERQISKNGTVNVNNIKALVGKGSKVEQAVVDKVLASEGFAGKKSIDYNKFRKAVQDELITYDRTPDTRWSDYGMGRIGQGMDGSPNARKAVLGAKTHMDRFNAIDVYGTPAERSSVRNLTFDLREGKISESDYDEKFNSIYNAFSDRIVGNSTPETFVFSSSRIPSGSAKHYDPNTLGHSRTYTSMDEPDVLHVMESQSDWAQSRRGNMLTEPINEASANEYKTYLEDRIKELEAGGYDEAQITPFREELQRHLSRWKVGYDSNSVQEQSNHLINNYTSRQIQENLRYAAEKGQTKMRYPTRETAAKIEGYPKKSAVENNPEFNKLFKSLESEFAEKYSLMLPPRDIIMNHPNIRSYFSELGLDISDDTIKLIHDIRSLKPVDGYLPSHETILKKYSDFPKQFKKIFKGSDVRTVTDPKGNTWYEVDVPENYLKQEWAYEEGGSMVLPKMMMGKHSPDKLRKAIANIKARRMK